MTLYRHRIFALGDSKPFVVFCQDTESLGFRKSHVISVKQAFTWIYISISGLLVDFACCLVGEDEIETYCTPIYPVSIAFFRHRQVKGRLAYQFRRRHDVKDSGLRHFTVNIVVKCFVAVICGFPVFYHHPCLDTLARRQYCPWLAAAFGTVCHVDYIFAVRHFDAGVIIWSISVFIPPY